MSHHILRYIIVTLLFLMLQACKCVDANEIKNWKWGEFSITGICPVNKFPVGVHPRLGIPEEKEAIKKWNKEFSLPVFVINSKHGIPIVAATKKHPEFAKRCEPVKLLQGAIDREISNHVFAWTDFKGSPGKWKIIIYVCLKKFRDAIKLVRTPVAQRAKEIGLYGYIKHELGHLLIGPGHPRTYAELMSSNQRNTSLHYHTKMLIKRTVIDVCQVTTKKSN